MKLNVAQYDLVQHLFIQTADENYVTARWCAVNGLNNDFFWLALHSLEKYMKAVLLMNGSSSKSYRHNIERLYRDTKAIAGTLLPEALERPESLDIHGWRDISSMRFIEVLHHRGNPDNRYGIYGYVSRSQYLHMLDEMVFRTRRLVCRLDEQPFKGVGQNPPMVTNRDLLLKSPHYWPQTAMALERLLREEPSPRRHAFLNLNLPFAPEDYPP